MALLFGRHSTGTLFVNSNQLLADVVGVGRLCIARDFFILRNMVGFSRQDTHYFLNNYIFIIISGVF